MESKYSTSCSDSNLGPRTRVGDTTKDLTRLGPSFKARTSEIRRMEGNSGMEERRSNTRAFLERTLNFEPRSEDEDVVRAGTPPLLTSDPHLREDF
ncbi:hypothetical protein AVEN_124334-1 [Araneus ventricosus]|uniref:Uncharacterized protein n=1 Tax=Araneus ventricosus TaxID=182803 RepID=A0A4Y2NJF4_ARAVE|nr:hypothetical protein AVEN_124334-1 [Araneus ventricosus]